MVEVGRLVSRFLNARERWRYAGLVSTSMTINAQRWCCCDVHRGGRRAGITVRCDFRDDSKRHPEGIQPTRGIFPQTSMRLISDVRGIAQHMCQDGTPSASPDTTFASRFWQRWELAFTLANARMSMMPFHEAQRRCLRPPPLLFLQLPQRLFEEVANSGSPSFGTI